MNYFCCTKPRCPVDTLIPGQTAIFLQLFESFMLKTILFFSKKKTETNNVNVVQCKFILFEMRTRFGHRPTKIKARSKMNQTNRYQPNTNIEFWWMNWPLGISSNIVSTTLSTSCILNRLFFDLQKYPNLFYLWWSKRSIHIQRGNIGSKWNSHWMYSIS